ncbi:UNVERIFIED_CONTAM: hypothetical protein H355_013312 [Colinus virginianus]|nr:hypothetical protein H355_013312 [Colinus virginianus]
MKGRRLLSNYEGLPPIKEECCDDLTETTAEVKYLDTNRLEPCNKFQDCLIRDKAQAILTNKLQHAKYDAASSPSLCASISEEILTAAKEMGFGRYKYVVTVLIVEKAGQAMNVSKHLIHNVHLLKIEN